MTTDMAEAVRNGTVTEEQLKEIEALARAENRPAAEIVDAALKLYKLKRLGAYGKQNAAEQGLDAKSEAHADRIVSKAVRETRAAKERGK